MVIRSFWDSYDFSNKKIIPFATSGDVDITNTENDVKNYLPDSTILQGLRLGSYDVVNNTEQIKNWLKKLDIIRSFHHDKKYNQY